MQTKQIYDELRGLDSPFHQMSAANPPIISWRLLLKQDSSLDFRV